MLLLSSMDEAINNQKITDTTQVVPAVSTRNKEAEVTAPLIESSEPVVKTEPQTEGFVQNSQPPVPHVPEVGLTPSAEATQVKTEPSASIVLPMTEQEALAELKKGSKSLNLHEIQEGEYAEDSKPFLAALVEKFFRGMRTFVKKPA